MASFHLDGAGTHNFWMDEEAQMLYAAYYNGGVIALDVSGTLSGDLSSRLIGQIRLRRRHLHLGRHAGQRLPLRQRHAQRPVAGRRGALSVSDWAAPAAQRLFSRRTSGYFASGSTVTEFTFLGPGTIAV